MKYKAGDIVFCHHPSPGDNLTKGKGYIVKNAFRRKTYYHDRIMVMADNGRLREYSVLRFQGEFPKDAEEAYKEYNEIFSQKDLHDSLNEGN